jgi:hypothetical protein
MFGPVRGRVAISVLGFVVAGTAGCDLSYLQRNSGRLSDAAADAPGPALDGATLACGAAVCAATPTDGCCSPQMDSLSSVFAGLNSTCATLTECPPSSLLATCQDVSDCLHLGLATPVCCMLYAQDDDGGNAPAIASIGCADETGCPTNMSEHLCNPGVEDGGCPSEDTCEPAPPDDPTYTVIKGFYVCR